MAEVLPTSKKVMVGGKETYMDLVTDKSGNQSYLQREQVNNMPQWMKEQNGYQVTGGSQPSYSAASTGPSASDLINSSYDKNYAAQAQKLKAARDQALAGLAGQDDLVKQTAFSNRNSNDVMAAQALQRVREQQANQGVNGGDSITATLNNNTDRQQSANNINTNEGNQLKQLMAQRDSINNNASADDFALMQQLQAARDTALANQANADRGFDRGVLESDRGFNYNAGQDTIKNGQWDKSFDYTKGVDQRNFDYSKGIDQRNFDYSKGIDQRNFDFQKTQTEWENNFKAGQFDWQKASDLWTRAFQEKNFSQQVRDAAASRGIQWAGLDEQHKARIADDLFREKSYKADQEWKQKDYNWTTSSKNPSNIKSGPKPTTYDQAYKDIDSSPFIANFGGQPIVKDQKGLGDYIFGLGLPEADTRKLYQRYGIQWGG